MSPNALPAVHLLIGPGTLPSQGRDRMDFLRYSEENSGRPRLTGQELLGALPEVAAVAAVTVDPGNPHAIAVPDDLRRLAVRLEALLQRPEVDAVVFVQGTNSLEETAYFLDLAVRSDKPIVVTGAQRPFTALSTDGPVNLIDAIRVAAAPQSRGMGVLTVTNGEINAARDVTKTSTYRVQTFRSRDLGVLGYADADRIVFYRAPLRRHTGRSEFDLAAVTAMPVVEILYVHAGSQAGLARAAVGLGAAGLVVAGSGAGSTAAFREELAKLAAQGIAVVRSARVGEGRVVRDDNWQEPGMVAADNLSPQKAAVLLSLAMTRTRDPDEIQIMFDEY
jgi:L-asparaginase